MFYWMKPLDSRSEFGDATRDLQSMQSLQRVLSALAIWHTVPTTALPCSVARKGEIGVYKSKRENNKLTKQGKESESLCLEWEWIILSIFSEFIVQSILQGGILLFWQPYLGVLEQLKKIINSTVTTRKLRLKHFNHEPEQKPQGIVSHILLVVYIHSKSGQCCHYVLYIQFKS